MGKVICTLCTFLVAVLVGFSSGFIWRTDNPLNSSLVIGMLSGMVFLILLLVLELVNRPE